MSDREPTRWQHNRIYPHPINPCVYTYDSIHVYIVMKPLTRIVLIGRLRFHDDNENDNENDTEISPSFSLRFCTQSDERLIASISTSSTTIYE